MGILDTLFGHKGEASISNSGIGALPGYAQNSYQDLVTRAQGLSNQTTPFAPVPFNPTQQSALNYAGQGVNLPNFNFGQQANTAYGNASNAYGAAGGYLQDASGNIAQGTNPITGQEINTNIGYFMNPFEDSVVNSSMQDINRQAALQNAGIQAQTANNGAFGSTRQAMDESELARNTAQQAANTSGQLRYAGFQNASNQAMQNLTDERNRFLQGAGLNINQAQGAIQQGQGYNSLGSNLMGARMDMGNLRQQQLQNQLGAGNIENQYQQGVNQIPIQQLNYLASILQSLPNSNNQIGPKAPTGGILGSGGMTSGIGNLYNMAGGMNGLSNGLASAGNALGMGNVSGSLMGSLGSIFGL